jgi:type II secretory pathway pseudopilin PulG
MGIPIILKLLQKLDTLMKNKIMAPPNKGKHSEFGFTLIELVLSLFIFTTILVVAVRILSPNLQSAGYQEESIKLNLLIKEKCELIKGTGFWVWDVDTLNPSFAGNKHDPAVKWASALQNFGYNGRGKIDVTFIKENAGVLEDFSGPEFDGNSPRNKVKIDVVLYNSQNYPITQNIELCLYPSLQKVKAIMAIIRIALDMYEEENGSYPSNGNLDTLVPNYLIEIPNDPYTEEKEKDSNTNEITDWYYNNSMNTITLSPNSHYGDSDFTEAWNY